MDLQKQHLHWTFKRLYCGKLYAGRAKCVFGQTQVEYLGHIVGSGVIAIDPAKTRAIMEWPEPTYAKHV